MTSSKNTDFDEFVKRQQELAAEAAAQPPFDAQKELRDWIGRLDALFAQVLEFLKAHIDSDAVSTEIEQIPMHEEFSGPYTAPRMTIRIGLQKIQLTPIGTMLIGSKGRVDVVGPAGTARLVLVGKSVTSASQLVTVTVVDPKKPTTPKKPTPGEIEWVWKILTRAPRVEFLELNKESFLEMLLEVSNA